MNQALRLNEDTLVEQPALVWLEELGWTPVHGSELSPTAPGAERADYGEVLLVRRVRQAIARLNPKLSPEAVDRVLADVRESVSVALIEDHYAFHEFLVLGVPVTWTDEKGEEHSGRARLVDFEDRPGKNEYLAVNQFTVVRGSSDRQKNRRPDILLFVNGIPLGQVEAKAPGDRGGQAAINQVSGYWQDIPYLYRFIEIIAVTDRKEARVGTITTPAEHFAEWKNMERQAGQRKQTGMKVMVRGVFSPGRLLDLIQNYVMFESDGARTWKVMAKYHQVHAVEKALEATWEAMNGDGRAGVLWYTQGSGKSYVMVFFASKVRKDPRYQSPTVVALTDREQLDDQLYKTFRRQKHLTAAVKRAERIEPKKSGERGSELSLHELLQMPPGDIVFTTIQKFEPGREREEMPVLSERRNIIVMADEAHRTQYGRLARNVTRALPNATRIGFTGTPIEAKDRNTRVTFGDYISVYRVSDAEEDGAVVPIYYESRVVPLEVRDEDLLKDVEETLSEEDEVAARRLQTSWARLEKVVGTEDRLDRVANDIAEHYTERCKTLDGKAMVVGYSQRICAELVARLQKHLGQDAVTAVISATATDDPAVSAYRRTRQQREDLEEFFKKPDSPLKVVVVRDMWLTGFDAPALHTLYIDKPMKDHGLLQAIARVNRVFGDKPGGLVVDYIGIGEDLRASLQAYASEDIDDVAVPLAVAVKSMKEKHDVVCALLHGVDFQGWESMSVTEVTDLLDEASDRILEDTESTNEFLKQQMLFKRWFALASTTTEAVAIERDAEFFDALAREVRAYATPEHQASPEAEQVIKQFISTGLAAGEIVDVLALSGKERPEVSVLSDEFLDEVTRKVTERPNLAVQAIRKLLAEEVRVQSRTNHLQAKLFSDRIEELLAQYESRQLTSAQIVERLVEIAKQLREVRHRHEALGLSEEEAAFYDAIAGDPTNWTADPKLVEITRELVKGIRSDLAVDWTSDESTEAAIRRRIKHLLRRHRGELPTPPTPSNGGGGGGGGRQLDFFTDLILEQARVLYRRWPEVEFAVIN
jgi:type I restriction enzyme R subunit